MLLRGRGALKLGGVLLQDECPDSFIAVSVSLLLMSALQPYKVVDLTMSSGQGCRARRTLFGAVWLQALQGSRHADHRGRCPGSSSLGASGRCAPVLQVGTPCAHGGSEMP